VALKVTKRKAKANAAKTKSGQGFGFRMLLSALFLPFLVLLCFAFFWLSPNTFYLAFLSDPSKIVIWKLRICRGGPDASINLITANRRQTTN